MLDALGNGLETAMNPPLALLGQPLLQAFRGELAFVQPSMVESLRELQLHRPAPMLALKK